MRLFLMIDGGHHVEIGEGVDFVLESLNYNPLEVGKGIVGFHLKGEKVVPVVDLNAVLGLPRKRKIAYLNLGEVTFLVWYENFSLERPESEPVDLESLKDEVLEYLGVKGWKGSKT